MTAQGKVIVGRYPPGYKTKRMVGTAQVGRTPCGLDGCCLARPHDRCRHNRREDGTWAIPRSWQTLPIVEGEIMMLRAYLGREIDDILY